MPTSVVAYGVETNRVATGAYRAPGAPQATFALEQLVDELAGRLGIDPIELRRRNLVAADDEMADGTPWGVHRPRTSASTGSRRIRSIGIGRRSPTTKASGWPSGPGRAVASRPSRSAGSRRTAGSPSSPVSSTCPGRPPGSRRSPPRGSGSAGGHVSVVTADTASAPRSPMTGGSVITYSMGRAVQRATEALRDKILAYRGAHALEIDVADLELVDGVVRPKGTPGSGPDAGRDRRFASMASPASSSRSRGTAGSVPPVLAPLTSAHLVRVRVDPRDGRGRASSAMSSPRTSGGPSTRPSSRASSRVGRRRGSAGRCARRWSTTRRASS